MAVVQGPVPSISSLCHSWREGEGGREGERGGGRERQTERETVIIKELKN